MKEHGDTTIQTVRRLETEWCAGVPTVQPRKSSRLNNCVAILEDAETRQGVTQRRVLQHADIPGTIEESRRGRHKAAGQRQAIPELDGSGSLRDSSLP